MTAKPSNPKDALAISRAPLQLVPGTAVAYAALAYAEGALKYGPYNWRTAGVSAGTYKAAAQRHLEKWWNGEWADAKTGVPHLASVLASIGIVLDAHACGMLTDDRPPPAPVSDLMDEIERGVAELRGIFGAGSPGGAT
ncbi:hypothetical protein J5J86_13855 [Aquabacter sp. L1I39]|uniref:dATP/dGTP diphosphohydrolase domain-containing protein n=1 Tax=Aquabacter sp. L1I39 TaxID=2820278 RepID=UPI001ADD26A5|nr:dATP/dGTP diphosphohydrolase domain-containing protein [Aquabacter sp. L1I39]QTL01890.1 hypothetical protein J5J86_13855 [Aquabacter sp. L1I39]